jgi:Family of unknown function (DUF6496)
MPKKQTIERARRDEREGKSASTQAGEFVREEIEEIRAGKHGARSTKQAIAIGLSKARRAGVKLAPPKPGKTSEATRHKAQRDLEKADSGKKPSAKRSQATLKALQRERCGGFARGVVAADAFGCAPTLSSRKVRNREESGSNAQRREVKTKGRTTPQIYSASRAGF